MFTAGVELATCVANCFKGTSVSKFVVASKAVTRAVGEE